MLTTAGRKAASRGIPVAIQAVCLLVALVLVIPVSIRVPRSVSASALSAITVSAADVDENGLLDTVLVNFTTNLTVAGLFEVSAELDVPLPGPMAMEGSVRNGTALNLTAEPHPFSLVLPGQLIPDAARDGPYNLTVAVVQFVPGQPPSEAYAVTVHTPPWTRTEFDVAPVRFDGQILEEPRDIRGDGHYDEFLLFVPVSVARATWVNLTGSFVPPPDGVTARAGGRVLGKGFYVLNLTFDGLTIYETRTNGPYWVSLDLSDGAGLAHRAFHHTEPFLYTDFARPGADFRGPPTVVPHHSAADGRIDALQVQVALRVRLAGDYAAWATASGCPSCGPTVSLGARRLLHLAPGNVTVDLNVSAAMLSRYVTTTPVSLDVIVYGLLGVGGYNMTSVDAGLSNLSLLENPYEEPLNLNLTLPNGNCGSPLVDVLDPTNGFFVGATVEPTNSSSRFPFPLYNGTFELVVEGSVCTRASSSFVMNATVEGPTFINLNTSTAIPPQDDVAVDFPSWSTVVADVRVNWTGLSPYLRFFADAYGNQDGYANPEELRLAVEDARYPWNYIEDIALDGMPLTANVSALSVAQGDAGIASNESVVTDLHTTSSLGLPATPGPSHTAVIDLPCCDISALHTLAVQLPPDADGAPSVVRYSPTDFNPLLGPANATATQTAPGAWTFGFGATPPSGAPSDEFRITIAATQGTGTPVVALPLAIGVAVVAAVAVLIAVFFVRRRKTSRLPPSAPPPHP